MTLKNFLLRSLTENPFWFKIYIFNLVFLFRFIDRENFAPPPRNVE